MSLTRRKFLTASAGCASIAVFADDALGGSLPQRKPIRVAFLLGDGTNVIDLAGPWEVFQDTSAGEHEDMPFELFTVAPTTDLISMTGGLKVNGLTIATDRDSQSMIANAYAGMQASGAESVKFKAASGWIELTADQIKAIALAVFAHVQACFTAEDGCDAGINASPPTIATFDEVDAAFAGLAIAP